MRLNEKLNIIVKIPEQKIFSADEVEVWLCGEDLQICLYKDSFRNSFLSEVSYVVDRYSKSRADDEYLIHKYRSLLNSDDSLCDYLLFEQPDFCTFLFCSEPDLAAKITVYAVSADCVLDESPVASATISRQAFLSWFHHVLDDLLAFNW